MVGRRVRAWKCPTWLVRKVAAAAGAKVTGVAVCGAESVGGQPASLSAYLIVMFLKPSDCSKPVNIARVFRSASATN